MNLFFIEFRDPLFGLIVFFTLIFVITFVSYWWGKYKYREDSKYLDKFLKDLQKLQKGSAKEFVLKLTKSELRYFVL